MAFDPPFPRGGKGEALGVAWWASCPNIEMMPILLDPPHNPW
ncbi:hypothetical protein TCCBUS3UF1_2090 [Thermus sp. CCB_US3_UF1]|nr:hypothetical protein TCCBUS3UF1_2090 [Thermus sp. CCB_US3_UF1]